MFSIYQLIFCGWLCGAIATYTAIYTDRRGTRFSFGQNMVYVVLWPIVSIVRTCLWAMPWIMWVTK